MWTCDIIKAMQIIEKQEGCPACVNKIVVSMTGVIIIETSDGTRHHFDTILGQFID